MITFKQFLSEARRQPITEEAAIKLLKTHAKQAIKHFDQPLFRGIAGSSQPLLLNGEEGKRKSNYTAGASNYYTVLLDHSLVGYPKRSASTIMTSDPVRAEDYGNVFAMFPYDDIKLGVASGNDIWGTIVKIGDIPHKIQDWNKIFLEANISDASFDSIVADIEKLIENYEYIKDPSDEEYTIHEAFDGDPANVEPFLEKAYSEAGIKSKLITPAQLPIAQSREVWAGGKVIALPHHIWQKLSKNAELFSS